MNEKEKCSIRLLKNENVRAVFFCDTLSIYPLSEDEYCAFKDFLQTGTESASITELLTTERERQVRMDQKSTDSFSFYTLILNTANCCNMKCAYCFANHGCYASPKEIMSAETAIKAVDICFRDYGFIGEIKFFGGEPLLGLPTVKTVCAHVTALYEKGEISSLPEFRLISNGTVMNAEVVDLIVRYRLQYVVSMDGFPEEHNQCRKMADGSGSFATILKNLNYLKETSGKVPAGLEITYNSCHAAVERSVLDIVRFLSEQTGVDPSAINLSPVMTVESNPAALSNLQYVLADYLDEIFAEKRRTGIDYADKKFRGLVRLLRNRMRSGNSVCEAGQGCLSVSAAGNIYPCLMFTDANDYLLGDLEDSRQNREQRIRALLPAADRLSHNPCAGCFMRRVCRECMGINRLQTGSVATPLRSQCAALQKRTEKAILSIAEGLY